MSDDPLHVFISATEALARGDWLEAAMHFDAESLSAFREGAIGWFDPGAHADALAMTTDEYQRHHPTVPREVAEYLLAQRQSRPSPDSEVRTQFPGFGSHEELLAAPAQHVFAAWLRGQSLRHRLEVAYAGKDIAGGRLGPLFAAAGDEYRFRPLGWLPEGESLAHVLFREAGPGADAASDIVQGGGRADLQFHGHLFADAAPLIATCRRQPDGTWRLMASTTFLRPSEWIGWAVAGSDEPMSE